MTSADHALGSIHEGSVVGLGTGRAATEFVRALGKSGLRIRGVATSETTAALARELGIELANVDEIAGIDVTVDGADEFDPELNLIKGYGGALLREKIVASLSKVLIILAGPEKQVPALGSRGRLPVEVVPFAHGQSARQLAELGCPGTLRLRDAQPFVTDNGNLIFDCSVKPISDPADLDRRIRAIPGIVATGIFAGMADKVIVQDNAGVRIFERKV